MRPLYIFDLDGTLALIDHRRHILEDSSNSNRWRDFYKACVHDKPNKHIIQTLVSLYSAGNDMKIFSARSEIVYCETIEWLEKYIRFPLKSTSIHNCNLDQEQDNGMRCQHCIQYLPFREDGALKMRQEFDYTPDQELKRKWLYELSQEDRARLVAVLGDRQRVVDMWRSEGVTCFQVAPGDF